MYLVYVYVVWPNDVTCYVKIRMRSLKHMWMVLYKINHSLYYVLNIGVCRSAKKLRKKGSLRKMMPSVVFVICQDVSIDECDHAIHLNGTIRVPCMSRFLSNKKMQMKWSVPSRCQSKI